MHGRRSPFQIELSETERAQLQQLVRCTTAPAGKVQRARIILRFASGETIAAISRDLQAPRHSVRKWVKRFCQKTERALCDEF